VRFGLSGEGFPLRKPEIKRSVLAFDAIEQMPGGCQHKAAQGRLRRLVIGSSPALLSSRRPSQAGSLRSAVRGAYPIAGRWCAAVRRRTPPRYAALPTTERDKELSGPNVWDREFDLVRRLAAGSIPKECANAVGCSTSCGLLAGHRGTRR